MIIHCKTQEEFDKVTDKYVDAGYEKEGDYDDDGGPINFDDGIYIYPEVTIGYEKDKVLCWACQRWIERHKSSEKIITAQDFLTVKVGDKMRCIGPLNRYSKESSRYFEKGKEYIVTGISEDESGKQMIVGVEGERDLSKGIWIENVIKIENTKVEPASSITSSTIKVEDLVRSKFKVGDKVRIIDWLNEDKAPHSQRSNFIGKKGVVSEKKDWNRNWVVKVEGLGDCGCFNEEIELIEEQAYINPDEPVEIKRRNEAFIKECNKMGESISNILAQGIGEVVAEQKIINNNKEQTIMEKIVQFAKNIALSADEKLLRKVGIKDGQGNYTEAARTIVVNFKAVGLGYKDEQDLFTKVGYSNNLSSFEYASLLKEYKEQLIAVAKEMEAEDKKSK